MFRCLWCLFECALEVCLSMQRLLSLDADLLMFLMRAHCQTCALRVRLLREAVYELSFVVSATLNSKVGMTQNDAVSAEAQALEHEYSVVFRGHDSDILSTAEVDHLLASIVLDTIANVQNYFGGHSDPGE
ncbi:hypothetical protein NDU88_006173 [Pleurodeles waltl]|uniref:Uncharacterized protein n=1 Tax=Pleurodeles waltl TaxID=8319 RepID=A0AAV7SP06_PLEWA|nr:hypothetical protein NDU88_006173 [Pleurodeles waltl]